MCMNRAHSPTPVRYTEYRKTKMRLIRFLSYKHSRRFRLIGFLVCASLLVCAYIASLLHRDSLNRKLIAAVLAGNVQGVGQVLRGGADPNACADARDSMFDPSGYNPVLIEAILGSREHPQNELIVRMLLEAGADVHAKGALTATGLSDKYDAVDSVNDVSVSAPRGVTELVMQYANRKR